MVICPVQNTGIFLGGQWLQKRPRITQIFGVNPEVYQQFGLKGHNGLDIGIPVGTPIHAPFEGVVTVVANQGDKGYGRYIEIKKDNLKIVLAHLSDVMVEKGEKVYMGDKIAESGNTGFSTGPHLHITMKYLDDKGKVINGDNGFSGAINPIEHLITWKGGFVKFNQ